MNLQTYPNVAPTGEQLKTLINLAPTQLRAPTADMNYN